MLPTFVIGLREGLEAALIVGIIAAFLRKQGRGELIRQLALGVAAAVAICIAVGVGLEVFSRNLPQRQQEGLETVIGILAVGMVTYMVLWMKEHSRELKGELESMAAEALEGSDGGRRGHLAMIAMAFLAVLREGFETSVFLLAAFNESDAGPSALLGAVLGIAVAVVLGYGIYRGGVRINLSRFFRATGVVLALVAAGLVVSAIHTAHEAGWLNVGQERLLDLSWLVRPGTVLSSLLTGMLGIQPYPVMAEILGWLLYAVPVVVFVAWPPGRAVPMRTLRTALAGAGALGLAAAGTLAWTAPSVATPATPTGSGDHRAEVVTRDGGQAVRTTDHHPLEGTTGGERILPLESGSLTSLDGVTAETYEVTIPGATRKARLPVRKAASLNGGRMPLGVLARHGTVGATLTTTRVATVVVEPETQRVLSLRWTGTERAALVGSSGQDIAVARPLHTASTAMPRADRDRALAAATADLATLQHRTDRLAVAWLFGLLGAAALLGLGLSRVRLRSTRKVSSATPSLAKT